MNESQGRSIKVLEEELKYQRDLNKILLDKLLFKEQKIIELQGLEPIETFVPLREKIRRAEEQSRKEFEERNASQDRETV